MVAVLPVGAVVAGLMALLFLLAWAQWGHAITQTLNVNVPIIGNAIGRLVSEALEASYLVLLGWFDAAVTPVADFIIRPIVAIESIFDALNGMGQSTLNAVISITTVKIPAAIGVAGQFTTSIGAYILTQVGGWVATLQSVVVAGLATERAFASAAVAAANQYTLNLANYLQGQFAAGLATLQSVVAAGLAAEHTFTLDAYNAAVNFTDTAYNAATHYSDQLAAAAAADLAAAVATTESYALTTATEAVGVLATDLDNEVTASLTAIWPDIATVIPELEGVIGTGDADILDALGRIDWTIPANLAGVASLAGVSALTLARYLKDCGIPNCQNLSQFGRDLQAAIAVVDDVAFIAFLLELIHDPAAAADLVESSVGDLIDAGLSAGRALLSV